MSLPVQPQPWWSLQSECTGACPLRQGHAAPGGPARSGVRAVESVNLWSHLANVGDTRSLILHPASTTHRQLSDDERLAAGAGPEVLRLSVGIESVDDLIADLDQAIGRTADRR